MKRNVLIVLEVQTGITDEIVADEHLDETFEIVDRLLDGGALQEVINAEFASRGCDLKIVSALSAVDRENLRRCTTCGELDAGATCCPPCDEPKCFEGAVLVTITPAPTATNNLGTYEVQRCEKCQRFNDNGEAAAFLAQFIGRDVI